MIRYLADLAHCIPLLCAELKEESDFFWPGLEEGSHSGKVNTETAEKYKCKCMMVSNMKLKENFICVDFKCGNILFGRECILFPSDWK